MGYGYDLVQAHGLCPLEEHQPRAVEDLSNLLHLLNQISVLRSPREGGL